MIGWSWLYRFGGHGDVNGDDGGHGDIRGLKEETIFVNSDVKYLRRNWVNTGVCDVT